MGTAAVIWNGRKYVGEKALDDWMNRRSEKWFREGIAMDDVPRVSAVAIGGEVDGLQLS